MPGGICAASFFDKEFVAAARCGFLILRVMGISTNVSLGGFAEAYFPEKSNDELHNLRAGEQITVVWERAVFHGRHPLLGTITARLRPVQQLSAQPSIVESVSPRSEHSFYPAKNRNSLVFSIHIPRFGLHLVSTDPIVNSSIISQIPPYGSIYELEKPVRFSPVSGKFKNLLAVDVEKCAIKLVELSNIKVTLSEIRRNADNVTYRADLMNETTEDSIQLSWMVWPEAETTSSPSGTITLDRFSSNIVFDVPKSLLTEQRWFAAAIAAPFHTDAAEIAKFPIEI